MKRPFNEGDIVKITEKTKWEEKTRKLLVRWIEDRGAVWYFGYVDAPGEPYSCGFGAASLVKAGPKRFGVQDLEVVGHTDLKPERSRSLVGNPAYDLMHNPDPMFNR